MSVAIPAVLLIALTIRLWFAKAPLWNDEIWSLINLRGVTSFGGVLWGISHDNNHFLNSLWLYAISGATLYPPALRLISILAGALSVAAMARLGGRRGGADGAFAAALLTALSFFQVVYGAEARGYAVATLALILAYDTLESALDAPARGQRLRLALYGGVGLFAHLAFAPALAALAFIAFLEFNIRGTGAPRAFLATLSLFWPAAIACAPTLAFVAAGYRNIGGFTIGALTPFALSHAIGGVATLAMMSFGLDTTSFVATAFALLALPLLTLAAILFLAPLRRKAAYMTMLMVFPALPLLLQLPNTHAARYFFACSPFLILLAADAFAVLARRGAAARAFAAALMLAALASNGLALARLARGEAHPYTQALAEIAASAEPTLASSHDFNVGKSVAFYAAEARARLDLIPTERICEARPGWYVVETKGDGQAEPSLSLGDCKLGYTLAGVFNRDVPSQLPWALYRR